MKANTEGLLPWADQGLFFCSSQGRPKLSLEEERLSLDEYYGGAFHNVSILSSVQKARVYHTRRISYASSTTSPEQQLLMDEIINQAERYGTNTVHANRGMDEECERELELEREIEEEKQVEIPRMVPLQESDWDKSIILGADSPSSLSGMIEIASLGDFVADKLQPSELSRFGWSQDVYGTSNFFRTVASQSGLPLGCLNHYLRMVDVFVSFPNKQVLLLSDREADELIELLWKHPDNATAKISLCHLSVLRSALDNQIPGLTPNLMVLGRKWNSSWYKLRRTPIHLQCPSDCVVATLQLFAGETLYRTQSRYEAVKDILRGFGATLGPAVADPEHIVDARGNSHLFQYSGLEAACRELAREEQQVIRASEKVASRLTE